MMICLFDCFLFCFLCCFLFLFVCCFWWGGGLAVVLYAYLCVYLFVVVFGGLLFDVFDCVVGWLFIFQSRSKECFEFWIDEGVDRCVLRWIHLGCVDGLINLIWIGRTELDWTDGCPIACSCCRWTRHWVRIPQRYDWTSRQQQKRSTAIFSSSHSLNWSTNMLLSSSGRSASGHDRLQYWRTRFTTSCLLTHSLFNSHTIIDMKLKSQKSV